MAFDAKIVRKRVNPGRNTYYFYLLQIWRNNNGTKKA
nr:MAG TPA: hypothetical protein [Caudoviricetes sp.]